MLTARKELDEERKSKEKSLALMLKGIPSPAWLIASDHRIIAQNAASAKLLKTKIGDFGESDLFLNRCLVMNPNSTQGKTANAEIELNGIIWETWWIPLGEGLCLYYAVDITKYKKTEEELLLLSITDALTNLYNRRYFSLELKKEIERVERSGEFFSVIMADIDRFKSINDQFGHSTGDIVLKSIAQVFQKRIRKTDTIARWGGEEFIILLPGTGVDAAVDVAEELREHLRQKVIPAVGSATASFGVAMYCPGDTADSIIQKADKLMYEAKADGRDCVRFTAACEYTLF